MFGYVRPCKGELKVKDFDAFKAVYCGVCHSLRRTCGLAARFVVNYDFTFLAMLLSAQQAPCWNYKRCIASPIRKKPCLCRDPALDRAAYYSVILMYWKLRDSVRDDKGFKRISARISCFLLGGAFRRAIAHAPAFSSLAEERLARLGALEDSRCGSIDRTADQFALILQAAASGVEETDQRRALSLLFYHTGRLIYILDAVDDLKEDAKEGRYNPLIYRFTLEEGGSLKREDADSLRNSLAHSLNLIGSAFQLVNPGPWTGILSNIIYLGMPQATEMVFSGSWGKANKANGVNRFRMNGDTI